MKIKVKVKPNSRENSIKEISPGIYEIRVTPPPEKGKANNKVIELLSKHFNTAKSNIFISSGSGYKEKIIEIKTIN